MYSWILGSGVSAAPTNPNDGFANAPAATAGATFQNASLFTSLSYPTRPPWKVAGVDYPVGVGGPTFSGTLKNPSTIGSSIPGVSVSGNTVTITGTNTVLDGYDFSLNNGAWQVVLGNCTNAVIRNCKFVMGSASGDTAPVLGALGAVTVNPTVEYCYIDGANIGLTGGYGGALVVFGNGSAIGSGGTVRYCYLANSNNDCFDHGGCGPGPFLYFNYMTNCAQGGGHGDYIQLAGGTSSAPFTPIASFNTVYHINGNCQGFMYEPDFSAEGDGFIGICETSNNTMLSPTTGSIQGMLYMTGATLFDLDRSGQTYKNINNYVDYSGSQFNAYATSGRGSSNDDDPLTVFSGNVNIKTGSKNDPGLVDT